MIPILRCEFLKLKHSKMILVSVLGALVTPLMVLVGVLKFKLETPGNNVTYTSFFSQCNQYMMVLFGLVVYTVIASYLFSREHTENTLKTILTIPVSKVSFLMGKFILLFFWIVCLTAVTWTASLALAALSGLTDFSLAVLGTSAAQYFGGTVLMYLTLTPFVFLSIWFKGLVVPIIAAATVAMGNVALTGESWQAFFPWSASYLLITGNVEATGYSVWMAIGCIAVVSIAGFAATMVYFYKEDVT